MIDLLAFLFFTELELAFLSDFCRLTDARCTALCWMYLASKGVSNESVATQPCAGRQAVARYVSRHAAGVRAAQPVGHQRAEGPVRQVHQHSTVHCTLSIARGPGTWQAAPHSAIVGWQAHGTTAIVPTYFWSRAWTWSSSSSRPMSSAMRLSISSPARPQHPHQHQHQC